MSASSRFAALPPRAARLLLVVLGLLAALGVAGALAPSAPASRLAAPGQGDAALYRAITHDTAAAGGTPAAYYQAAAAEQRARGYPLRPFVTVREPALALLAAWVGDRGTLAIFRGLALLAALLLAHALLRQAPAPGRVAGATLAAVSVAALATPALAVWHEAWAALLLVPAVTLAGTRGWPAACVAGLLAVLVRELAAPVLCALLFAAAAERRWREAGAWATVLALFGAALAMHASHVAAVLLPGDAVSPGWARVGGWRLVVAMAARSSVLLVLPGWAAALAVPAALLGWAAPATRSTDRVAFALAALAVPFCIVGRADNIYWGLLFAPALPAGLALAPRALRDLLRAARQAAPAPPWDAAWTADASS